MLYDFFNVIYSFIHFNLLLVTLIQYFISSNENFYFVSNVNLLNLQLYYIPTINTADFTSLFYYQIRHDRFHY